MIKAVFCTSKKKIMFGSWLISWGTKDKGQKTEETPSHVGFLFFDDIIIDSTLTEGIKEDTYGNFKKKHNILAVYDLDVTESATYRYLEKARELIPDSNYDFPAITYFSWRVFLKKCFNVPIPKENKFNVKRMHFCTEVMSIIDGKNYSIVSPNDLMKRLQEKKYKQRVY